MIAEPQPTPYDLVFRAFGFPVRVHPFFWLTTALLGQNAINRPNGGLILLIWIAAVFVSILVHELGHTFAYRWYGGTGRIWLYWFGGLAVSESPPRSPVKKIVISLAGPMAGFALAGVVYGSNQAMEWRDNSQFTNEFFFQMMFINVAWGILNLFPIYPLDGGQATREFCVLLGIRRAQAVSLQISMVTAGVLCVYSLMSLANQPAELLAQLPWWVPRGTLYTAIMFGLLGYGSYQMWVQVQQRDSYWDEPDDDTPPWRRR